MGTEPGSEDDRSDEADVASGDDSGVESGADTDVESGADADAETEPGEQSAVETAAESEVSSEERTWAILAHASAFVGFVIPFGNVLGPLLVWATKKDESEFVAENSREALNFQITWTILFIVVGLTLLIGIGVILLPIVGLVWLIFVVLAIVRASNDQVYDYPLTVDLIS